MFPPDTWSVYDCVSNEWLSHTNHLEGWHRGFEFAYGGIQALYKQPTIERFVKTLRSETFVKEVNINLFIIKLFII